MAKKFEIGIENNIKKNLPEEYTQLAYIQSSGTQCIDTGFKPNQDTSLFLTIDLPIQNSYPVAIFGSRNGSSSSSGSFMLWAFSATSFRSDYASNGTEMAISPISFVQISKEKNVTTINGTVLTHTATTFQSNYTLTLFAENDVDGIDPRMISGNLYSCKIYDNGILVRDYIPCKNSSDEIGLYDLVNNSFSTNVGTGTFIAGPEVNINNNKAQITEAYFAPVATHTIEPVERVEFDASQYIATGIYPNQDTKIDMVVAHISTDNVGSGVGFAPYGAGSNSLDNNYDLCSWDGDYHVRYEDQYYYASLITTYHKMRIIQDRNVFSIEDLHTGEKETHTFTKIDFTSSKDIYINALHRDDPPTYIGGYTALYSCDIYQNDELVYSLRPVKIIDNTTQAVTYGFQKLDGSVITKSSNGKTFDQGYKSAEYVEFTGTEYVKTGIYPNQDTKIDMVVTPLSDGNVGNGTGFIPYGGGNTLNTNVLEMYSWGTDLEIGYGNQKEIITMYPVGNKLHIVQDKNIITIDDLIAGTAYTNTFTYTAYTAPGDLYIGALHRTATSTIGYIGKMRVYSCKIYDNDILVRNLVPMETYYNNTVQYIFIDKVTGQPFLNQDSYIFTAGQIIPATETKQLAAPKEITKGFIGIESEEYTQLEYLESDTASWINTGYKPNNTTKIETTFTRTSNVGTTICGAREGSTGYLFYVDAANSYKIYTMYGTTYPTPNIVATVGTQFTDAVMDGVAKTVVANGSTASLPSSTFQISYPMYLFAFNESGTVNLCGGGMRIYYLRIYDNGILIRDYIPVKNSSGVLGMYDKVENKFYTNAGTGTFTAGSELGTVKFIEKRYFYQSYPFESFTGTYTVSNVTIDNIAYDLYTITGNGTLTLSSKAKIWMCGGGGGGAGGYGPSTVNSTNYWYSRGGGGGGGGYIFENVIKPGTYTVALGAGGTAGASNTKDSTGGTGGSTTLIRDDGLQYVANGGAGGSATTGGNGGSGGAAGSGARYSTAALIRGTAGTGQGVSTYPFGLTSLNAHCAGGGSGGHFHSTSGYRSAGAAGGTNGGNGNVASSSGGYAGGAGGTYGGGGGGGAGSAAYSSPGSGSAATFWGGGGGGGAGHYYSSTNYRRGSAGGTGKQGVLYILAKKNS